MKKKINIRLVGIAIFAMLLTTIGIIVCNYNLFQRQIKNDLSISAKLLKDTHYFETTDVYTHQLDLSTDIEDLRVTWIGEDGTVLYDNDTSADELMNHSDRPEIKEAFETGVGQSVRKSDTMKKNTFYYAVLLDNGTVLRVSTNAESIWSVFFSSAPVILILLLIIICACIALSHMLTVQLIRPIEMMAEEIEDPQMEPPYKELVPFANMIRKQHTDILSAARIRQDFTANVSHELKTPLTAISGYAELLENHMVDEAGKDHFYHEIRKNADRLVLLINDIINLSELDRTGRESTFEKIDLYNAVMDCMDALRVNAQSRNIKLFFEGEHAQIAGNPEMITELISNLVQNAIRYNNEGGSVWIEVTAGISPQITVRDNGIGIPPEDQERVFERFYRVDKSRSKATGGTGLGLAIVKHIVEIHDGTISLESELGKGTKIVVCF